jgi:hypothetical protein
MTQPYVLPPIISSTLFLEILNPHTTYIPQLFPVQNLLPSKVAEAAVLNIQEVSNLNCIVFSPVSSVPPSKQFQFITYYPALLQHFANFSGIFFDITQHLMVFLCSNNVSSLFLTQKSKQTLPTDRLLETQNKLNL